MSRPTSQPAFQGSPFNPPVSIPEPGASVVLHDVTLREGEQAAPVGFSTDDRVTIATALDRIGVPRIQAGFAGRDDDAIRAVRQAVAAAEVSALSVAFDDTWRDNIETAAAAGVDVLLVLFRASAEQMNLAGLTPHAGLRRVRDAVGHARGRIPRVVFQPSFATTADPAYLAELCSAAAEAGAQEIAVADTLGVATPEGTTRLVSAVRDAASVPVGVHLHDDFGLALANSLAALRAGATTIEVSVLGLGERAGNCALEELATLLEGPYGVRTGMDLTQLRVLGQTVATCAGVPIPAWKSIVGEDVFTQQLDIHVRVASHSPWMFEPFDPALVGQQRMLKLGRGSGPAGVQARLDALGHQVPSELIAPLVDFVNRLAVQQKGVVSDQQLLGEMERLRESV